MNFSSWKNRWQREFMNLHLSTCFFFFFDKCIYQLFLVCVSNIGWDQLVIIDTLKVLCIISLQLLADGVIPNEYGINPEQKLKIGSKVTSFLFYVGLVWLWERPVGSPTLKNIVLCFLLCKYSCWEYHFGKIKKDVIFFPL